MPHILLVGAGNIGEMIVFLLLGAGYKVTLADNSEAALAVIPGQKSLTKTVIDATDEDALVDLMAGKFAVISAAPFFVTRHVAPAALKAKIHYLDLTEDVAATKLVKEIAGEAESALIPQCGLAPGFISIVGYHLAKRFDDLHALHLRVGALPRYPSNSLTYNLTWSTDGVINEYCEPCEAIVNGKLQTVTALEGVEHFALDGVAYEAFNTSGGLGTLCETLQSKVRRLDYRTIRYPGHRDIMKTLIHDLRLGERRDLFREVLENAVPSTTQDVVVIFATATGRRQGRLMQESYANHVYAREIGGRHWAAIQITTASAVCAVLDMLHEGKLPTKGLVRQEQIALEDFLANRFGRAYLPQHG